METIKQFKDMAIMFLMSIITEEIWFNLIVKPNIAW